MIRSVPICAIPVIRRDLRNLRMRVTKGEGAVAAVREYWVTWVRKPESTISCRRWSGLASLKRKMRWSMISVGSQTEGGDWANRGQIVDVGHAQADQLGGHFLGDYLQWVDWVSLVLCRSGT